MLLLVEILIRLIFHEALWLLLHHVLIWHATLHVIIVPLIIVVIVIVVVVVVKIWMAHGHVWLLVGRRYEWSDHYFAVIVRTEFGHGAVAFFVEVATSLLFRIYISSGGSRRGRTSMLAASIFFFFKLKSINLKSDWFQLKNFFC